MIFRLFIIGLVLCINVFSQAPVAVTRDDVASAVSSFLESQKDEKDGMVQQLLKMERSELIKLLRNYDAMTEEDLNSNFGPDEIVLNGWYKELKESIFENEKERKNFERAIDEGTLVGLDDEAEIAVIEIENSLYIVRLTREKAELIVMKFAEVLESKTTNILATQEEDESDEAFEARKSAVQKELEKQMQLAQKKSEEAKKTKDKKKAEKLMAEAQKIAEKAKSQLGEYAKKELDAACKECFEKFGVNFLYGMLFFRTLTKASKPLMMEAIKTVKEKIRKK